MTPEDRIGQMFLLGMVIGAVAIFGIIGLLLAFGPR